MEDITIITGGGRSMGKKKAIADFFVKIIKDRKTNPYQLAKETGLSEGYIRGVIAAKTVPGVDNFAILCKALKVSKSEVSDIFKKII